MCIIFSTFARKIIFLIKQFIIMDISHIEHLGIAVKSIEAHLPYYENVLGLKCYSIEVVADQKVRTAFFKVGQTKIELLEPTGEDSAVAKFIENRGEGIHHIAFAVPSVQDALDEVASKGVRLIDQHPRGGAEGLQIAFLHPKSTGSVLTELCMKGD
jgi:methylmalonyl-CoA/ethylmalonyl-CoA epimerase